MSKVIKYNVQFNDLGKHGEITTMLSLKDMNDADIDYVDIVKVTMLDQVFYLPFVPSYRCIKSGGELIMYSKEYPHITVLAHHSNFIRNHHVAAFIEGESNQVEILPTKKVKFPFEITFELYKKKGYEEEFKIYDLKRSNNREDYPKLNDEEFCNFRCVKGGLIKQGILYRSSSPIDNMYGRAKYADSFLEKYKIKTIINLADSEEYAKNCVGFNDTYYSKQNVLYLNANADIVSYNFGKCVVKAIRFILTHEGPYLVHCLEGQDRTGAICALFASMLDASKQELIEDFMKTYENFYYVEKNSNQYNVILKGKLQKNIMSYRGFSYDVVDILKNPESYMLFLDLKHEELKSFRDLLANW